MVDDNPLHHVLEEALHHGISFGSLVLIFGIATAVLNFGLLLVQYATGFRFRMLLAVTQKRGAPLTLDRTKLELAQMVGFSLLLLVAVDVLETMLKPGHEYGMEELYKMILIGAIRTTAAYFLGKETEEIMHHIKHSEGHEDVDEHGQGEEPKEEEATPTTSKSVAFVDQNSSGGKNKNKKRNKQKRN